jgi:hypothetical protein
VPIVKLFYSGSVVFAGTKIKTFYDAFSGEVAPPRAQKKLKNHCSYNTKCSEVWRVA